MSQPVLRRKRQYLLHFIAFSAILFLFIFVVGSAAFLLSMRQIIRSNKGDELVRLLDTERHKMEMEVEHDIAGVLKMASSPVIQQHFLDPDNLEIAATAFKDIEGYRAMFSSASIFWVKDNDKKFFTDKKFFAEGKEDYTVDPTDPVLYWYNMTMYETERYNFNIDFDPHLKVTNIWINAPVYDPDGKPIGILGIGVNLSDFIFGIYQNYSGSAEFYFFNTLGEITGSKKVEQVSSKEHIDTMFGAGFF